MLYKLPALPSLDLMLDDLGNPPARVLAGYLGASDRQLRRWRAGAPAPRAALVALFWVTRWGASLAHCEAVNDARWARGHLVALQRENTALRAQLARLTGPGAQGAANDQIFNEPGPGCRAMAGR